MAQGSIDATRSERLVVHIRKRANITQAQKNLVDGTPSTKTGRGTEQCLENTTTLRCSFFGSGVESEINLFNPALFGRRASWDSDTGRVKS